MARLKSMTMEELDAEFEEVQRERGIDEIINSLTVESAEAEYRQMIGVDADE